MAAYVGVGAGRPGGHRQLAGSRRPTLSGSVLASATSIWNAVRSAARSGTCSPPPRGDRAPAGAQPRDAGRQPLLRPPRVGVVCPRCRARRLGRAGVGAGPAHDRCRRLPAWPARDRHRPRRARHRHAAAAPARRHPDRRGGVPPHPRQLRPRGGDRRAAAGRLVPDRARRRSPGRCPRACRRGRPGPGRGPGAAAAGHDADPRDHPHASVAYTRHVAGVLVRRVLAHVTEGVAA